MIALVYMGKRGGGAHDFICLSNASKNVPNSLCIHENNILKCVATCLELRKSNNYEFVFWMLNHKTLIVLFMLRLFRIPVGGVFHNKINYYYVRNNYLNIFLKGIHWLHLFVLNRAFFISPQVSHSFKKYPLKKILLSNSLPAKNLNKISYEEVLKKDIDILVIGRSLHYKGFGDLFNLFTKVTPPSKFKIVVASDGVNELFGNELKNLQSSNLYSIEIFDNFIDDDNYLSLIKRSTSIFLPYTSVSQAGPLADAAEIIPIVCTSGISYFYDVLDNTLPNVIIAPLGQMLSTKEILMAFDQIKNSNQLNESNLKWLRNDESSWEKIIIGMKYSN